jgi:hypothetical protein
MYKKLSVGIGSAYLWFIACHGCEISYFQSPAVLSKTAKIQENLQVAASCSQSKNELMSHSEWPTP